MNSAETAIEASSLFYQLLHSGLLIDAALIIAIFLVRVILLGVTAKAVSHGMADVGVKACVYATLILCTVFFVANPTLQTSDVLRPYLVMAFVGILVCKKAFWIHLDQALYCSLIFCLLSIFVGDYSRREVDKRYPERPTINRALASVIDEHARQVTNGPPREPSEDILTALVQASSATTSGVLGSMLGFIRAGLEVKEQMARLNKITARKTMIANMLAEGGTNVGNRAWDMAAVSSLPGSNGGSNAPVAKDTNGTRRGHRDTYAAAKAQPEEINRIASNNAAIVNMLSGIGTDVDDRNQEMDKLNTALLEEAMRGTIDLSTPAGEPITEEQIAGLRAAMGMGNDPDDGPEAVTTAIDGTATNTAPVEQLSTAAVQEAIDDMRRVAAAYAALLGAETNAGTRAAETVRREKMRSWNGPSAARVSKPGLPVRLVRLCVFDRFRREYRAPWEGVLRPIRTTPVIRPAVQIAAPAAPQSKIVSVKANSAPPKAVRKAKPPPPRPYDLLSKVEHAKWDAALQKIQVTGVVGSSADVAAIVNGALIRRDAILVVDSAGSQYSFRLAGINKKGKCQWEPVIVPAKEKSVTIRF
ncbi:MAG: hypothetical protein V1929_04815 [bacterium]